MERRSIFATALVVGLTLIASSLSAQPPPAQSLDSALGPAGPSGPLKGDGLAAKISEASRNALGAKENPVRVNGVAGERAYLERLRCSDDAPPLYTRTGSFGIGVFGGIIDGYRLVCASGGPREATVYMDMYHPDHLEAAAPTGFKIVAADKN